MLNDIFDKVKGHNGDVFDRVISKKEVKEKFPSLPELERIFFELLKKIPPRTVERVIEKPIQITKVEKQDLTSFKNELEDLRKELQTLMDKFERLKEIIPLMGGSGVIGIPNPEGNNGKVLQVVSNQAKWQTASGGGSSPSVYTPTNVVTDRSYDATNTSIDEIANVLGS